VPKALDLDRGVDISTLDKEGHQFAVDPLLSLSEINGRNLAWGPRRCLRWFHGTVVRISRPANNVAGMANKLAVELPTMTPLFKIVEQFMHLRASLRQGVLLARVARRPQAQSCHVLSRSNVNHSLLF
jgi:hypothetical protein